MRVNQIGRTCKEKRWKLKGNFRRNASTELVIKRWMMNEWMDEILIHSSVEWIENLIAHEKKGKYLWSWIARKVESLHSKVVAFILYCDLNVSSFTNAFILGFNRIQEALGRLRILGKLKAILGEKKNWNVIVPLRV